MACNGVVELGGHGLPPLEEVRASAVVCPAHTHTSTLAHTSLTNAALAALSLATPRKHHSCFLLLQLRGNVSLLLSLERLTGADGVLYLLL